MIRVVLILGYLTTTVATAKTNTRLEQSDQPLALSPPRCFKKTPSSSLNAASYRPRKQDSPQNCANICFAINGDEKDRRACQAFDFNPSSGLCRFYDLTSKDGSARVVSSSKTDLYESDGSCAPKNSNNNNGGGGKNIADGKNSTAAVTGTAPAPGRVGPKSDKSCFKTTRSARLAGVFPYRSRRYNSVEQCTGECVRVFTDEEDPRTCRASDYNSKSGVCRFYERNSLDNSGNNNARVVDSSQTDLHEFDESCWRQASGPSTLPPHVNACSAGTKPMMEKVNGWHLDVAGLAFKSINESVCYDRCLKDKLPSRDEDYKCLSVSYNKEKQVCLYLNTIASPLNRHGPSLTQDTRYTYYSKMCLPSDAISKCPGYITRFTGRELVSMTDAKITTQTYPECVKACLKAQTNLGFECLSGMFYNNATSDNCVLNYADHYQEPSLFIFDPKHKVDYFSIKSCHW